MPFHILVIRSVPSAAIMRRMDNPLKMEATLAPVKKCDNSGNQLIITTMKGIKQIDKMGVMIVISHSNECGQRRRFWSLIKRASFWRLLRKATALGTPVGTLCTKWCTAALQL